MSATHQFSIELLAPARNVSVAVAAINHGADAVYIGAPTHGARAAAANSISDIAAVCDYAHQFGARVYVTVNTIVYESELRKVEQLIKDLYRIGVDALIVQDLGLLRLDLPPIALHASTQCDIRTPERALFLQSLGFSQLVLPREFTLEEIKAMRQAVSIPLEAFVHGALCVSYSGDCRASLLCGGRSANRGECAHICRLPYNLIDGKGDTLIKNKHLLSLRDLNRLSELNSMISAGISSLKIEGRLKDESYVKNVVSAYDMALRTLGVPRTSHGMVERNFTPDVERSFNRGFTKAFLFTSNPPAGSLANHKSPKSTGPIIATVTSIHGRKIVLKNVKELLNNGDGLNFGPHGFRVNKVESPTTIITQEPVSGLNPGMDLRRNFDKKFTDTITSPNSATRYIGLRLTLRRVHNSLILEDADGTAASIDFPKQDALTPQEDARKRIIAKLGNTVYRLENFTDHLEHEFVTASALTKLRREFIEMKNIGMASRFKRELRRAESKEAKWPEGTSLTFHNNVANSMAEAVYRSHGVHENIEPALEISRTSTKETEVMCTRYCLRRELGKCLKEAKGREWKEPLSLYSPGLPPLNLHFDCANCQMRISIKS